ncbi:MAG: hypothetical protein ACE5R4_13260 [Armatimonadota bacterium]
MKHGLGKATAGLALVAVIGALTASAAQADPGDVGLNNRLLLRIRTNAAGWTILERRTLVDQRLVHVLSYENTIQPDVRIGDIRGKPTIYVGDTKLITVYPRDAEANAASMERLAEIWAGRVAEFIKVTGPAHGKRIPTAPPPPDNEPPVVREFETAGTAAAPGPAAEEPAEPA